MKKYSATSSIPTNFVTTQKFSKILISLTVMLTLIPFPIISSASLPDYRIEQYGTSGRYYAIELIDMDNDGQVEMLAGNRGSHLVEIWKYNAISNTLELSDSVLFPQDPHAIRAGDLDGDGDKDLVVGLRFSGLYVAINTGSSWRIRRVDSTYNWEVILADFNLDGNLDAYHGTDWGFMKILYGDGTGNLVPGPAPTAIPVNSRPVGLNVTDLNNDGRPDLIGPTREGSNWYMRAFLNTEVSGKLTWSSVGPVAPQTAIRSFLSPSAADMNSDGYVDQVVINPSPFSVVLYKGGISSGQLTWQPGTIDSLSTFALSAGIGDINDDGHLDIHIQGWNYFNGVRVYLGDSTGNFTYENLPLGHGVGQGNSFRLGDLNGDGRTDIATLRYDGIGDSGFLEVLYPLSPIDMITQLIATVVDLNLQQGIENSLDAKLETTQSVLEDLNDNNNVAALNSLQAFINAVEAQRGNHISDADADTLVNAANSIISALTNT